MNIWVLPSFAAVAILAGLTFYVLVTEPPGRLGPSTRSLLFAALLFAVGDTATYFSTGPNFLWIATSLSYTGLMLVVASTSILAHRYAQACGQPMPWSKSYWEYLPVLLIAPLWLGMITNPLHEQFISLSQNSRNQYHWMWHAHTYVSYLVGAMTLAIFATLSIRTSSKSQRKRTRIMLAAPFITFAGNLAYLVPDAALPFDPTAIALAGTGTLFFVGIYRVGLFSLNPVAMSSIINHQPNGIVVTDMQGTLLHRNDAAEQILRATLFDTQEDFDIWLAAHLTKPDSDQSLAANEMLATIENLEIEAPIPLFKLLQHPDTWLQIRVDNILSRSDRTIARSYFIRDVTQYREQEAERRSLERKMFQSQKLEGIGLLAGGIAHDFNNLLMAIRGNAELLSTNKNLDSNALGRIEVIESVSDRAARLTKKLLMYSGDAPAIKTQCNLSQLVQETSELIHTALLPKQLSLDLQLADQCWIEGDESQLEQVLLNLAINAAEAYEGRSGTVQIRTSLVKPSNQVLGRALHGAIDLEPDIVLLEVVDAGCGMSENTQDRIADPFFSSKGYGRGLGLSAVLGIVRSHSGAIYANSSPGEGTRFSVLFPRQIATIAATKPNGPMHQEPASEAS